MSIFDAAIAILTASIGIPSPEALADGAPPVVELGLIAGLTLPFANPATGEPMVIPAGKLRYTFTKEQAIKIFSEALEAAQRLPEPVRQPDVMTAASMAEVERMAAEMKRVME